MWYEEQQRRQELHHNQQAHTTAQSDATMWGPSQCLSPLVRCPVPVSFQAHAFTTRISQHAPSYPRKDDAWDASWQVAPVEKRSACNSNSAQQSSLVIFSPSTSHLDYRRLRSSALKLCLNFYCCFFLLNQLLLPFESFLHSGCPQTKSGLMPLIKK